MKYLLPGSTPPNLAYGVSGRQPYKPLLGEQTIQDLGSRYGVHPNQITNWKRQAIDNMADTFSTKAERTRNNDDPQIKELHAKIGQLTVERDFLANAFGRIR